MDKGKVFSGGKIFDAEDLNDFWRDYQEEPIQAIRIIHPFVVETSKGEIKGDTNDYVIKDVDGELSLCKKEVFHKKYKRKYPTRGAGIANLLKE